MRIIIICILLVFIVPASLNKLCAANESEFCTHFKTSKAETSIELVQQFKMDIPLRLFDGVTITNIKHNNGEVIFEHQIKNGTTIENNNLKEKLLKFLQKKLAKPKAISTF